MNIKLTSNAVKAKSVHERMAASPLRGTAHITEGDAPQRKFLVQFSYENGLVVNHDGEKTYVVRPEFAVN